MECSSNIQLEKMHSLELKIALEIKRICEMHHISYFLTAGTLLGAVRHGGFIPWDDDMDIGMLRKDYNSFVEACKTDLGKEFFLQTWDSDPDYPFSYGKIRLKGTHFSENFSENTSSENNGIFVDIFPFDNVPDDPKQKKRQAKRYFICKRLLWIKKGMGTSMKRGSFKEKLKYYIFWMFSHLFKYNAIKTYYKNIQEKYNGSITDEVVTDGAYGYYKESLDRKWVTNLEPVQFETELFLSYKDKIEYLEYFYGDYMKLPPENKRGGHGIKNIDFGPY